MGIILFFCHETMVGGAGEEKQSRLIESVLFALVVQNFKFSFLH
jgi:hypothetical protein